MNNVAYLTVAMCYFVQRDICRCLLPLFGVFCFACLFDLCAHLFCEINSFSKPKWNLETCHMLFHFVCCHMLSAVWHDLCSICSRSHSVCRWWFLLSVMSYMLNRNFISLLYFSLQEGGWDWLTFWVACCSHPPSSQQATPSALGGWDQSQSPNFCRWKVAAAQRCFHFVFKWFEFMPIFVCGCFCRLLRLNVSTHLPVKFVSLPLQDQSCGFMKSERWRYDTYLAYIANCNFYYASVFVMLLLRRRPPCSQWQVLHLFHIDKLSSTK